jgi:hypothetical protein
MRNLEMLDYDLHFMMYPFCQGYAVKFPTLTQEICNGHNMFLLHFGPLRNWPVSCDWLYNLAVIVVEAQIHQPLCE